MAAILPSLFDGKNEALEESARTLEQYIDQTTKFAGRLRNAMQDQADQMSRFVTSSDQADRAEERRAYRGKCRRVWRDSGRPDLVAFLLLNASEQNRSNAEFLKSILEAIATDQGVTLADLLTEIGSA